MNNKRRDHILPNSVTGDWVHVVVQPLLQWLIDNGDAEMKAIAIEARAYWEQKQTYIIDWCNEVEYFTLAQMACQNLSRFRKMLVEVGPQTEMQMKYYPDGQSDPIKVDVIAWLALKAGERWAKVPQGAKNPIKFKGKKQS